MTIETTVVTDLAEATDNDTTGYLTRREAAERCRVPLSTFDTLRRQNRIPFPDAQMGKHMLWRAATIETFLDGGGTRAN